MKSLPVLLVFIILFSCKDSDSEKVSTVEEGTGVLEINGDSASRVFDFEERDIAERALEIYRRSDRRFEGKYLNVYDVGGGRKIAAILNLVKFPAQKIYDNFLSDTSAYRADLLVFNSWGSIGDIERFYRNMILFSPSGDSLRTNILSFGTADSTRVKSMRLKDDELTLNNPFADSQRDVRPWLFKVDWKMKRVSGPFPSDKGNSPYMMKDDWLFTDSDFQQLLKQNNFQL